MEARDILGEELYDAFALASSAKVWEKIEICESKIGRAIICRMINSGLAGGEWLRIFCGANEKKKENCCAMHATSRIMSPNLATEKEILEAMMHFIDLAPSSDVDRVVGKPAAMLVESIASCRALTNDHRKDWLIKAIGTNQAKKIYARGKEAMIKALKQHATTRGLFHLQPPKIFEPLYETLQTNIFKLKPHYNTYVRRVKRLYVAFVDGIAFVAHIFSGNHYFRPSLTARFTILQNEQCKRKTAIHLVQSHPFFLNSDFKVEFEQFEAAIELRSLQDCAIYKAIEDQAWTKFQNRRQRRLDNEHFCTKEKNKSPEQIQKDFTISKNADREQIKAVLKFRPLKSFDESTLLNQYLPSSFPLFKIQFLEDPFFQRLMALAKDSLLARCAVYALACFNSLESKTTDTNKDYNPFKFVHAQAILSEIALRGIFCKDVGNETLEKLCASKQDYLLVISALQKLCVSHFVPPSIRGEAAKRISICLGKKSMESYLERLDFIQSILIQDDQAITQARYHDILDKADRLALENNIRKLYDDRNARGLKFLAQDKATQIALRAKEQRKAVPVEQICGGNNPLGCHVGEHSKLVDSDDEHDFLTEISVEERSIKFYRQQFFWGSHCEGALLVPLARILLREALLLPIGFVSTYSILPIDLKTPFFAVRRRQMIQIITNRILQCSDSNQALAQLIASEYSESCTDPLFCVSRVKAPLYMLQAIGLAFGSIRLANFVKAYADNGCDRSGLPDLLLLRVKSEEQKDFIHPDALLTWLSDGNSTTTERSSKINARLLARYLAADDDSDAFSFTSVNQNDTDAHDEEEKLRKRQQAAELEAARLAQPIHPLALKSTFECRLIEVKSQNDNPQDHQRVWFQRLLEAGIDVAIAKLPNSGQYKENIKSAKTAKRQKTQHSLPSPIHRPSPSEVIDLTMADSD